MPDNRNPKAVLFGVLESARLPKRRMQMVDQTWQKSLELRFDPIASILNFNAALGFVELTTHLPHLAFTTRAVQFVSAGHKQTGTLHVLEMAPKAFTQQPKVKLQGIFKGVDTLRAAFEHMQTPTGYKWWLALTLAASGYITCVSHDKVANQYRVHEQPLPEQLERIETIIFWRDYLTRLLNKLERQLQLKRNRNPFRQQLRARDCEDLLGIENRTLSIRLLGEFAQQYGTQLDTDMLGALVLLPAHLTSTPQPAEEQIGKIITQLVDAGEVVTRRGLKQRYASDQHIIDWLFSARILIETPTGYVFTAAKFEQYLKQLNRDIIGLTHIGVRDIKDKLGLSRRPAEALRAFLEGYSPTKAIAQRPGGGENV